MPDELYVLHRFTCSCGTSLEVHAQHILGGWQGRYAVNCPKCDKEQEIPTRPLRSFYEDGDHWAAKFLKPEA